MTKPQPYISSVQLEQACYIPTCLISLRKRELILSVLLSLRRVPKKGESRLLPSL